MTMEISATPPVVRVNPIRWIGLLLAFGVAQVMIISYSHSFSSSSSSSSTSSTTTTTTALSSSIKKNTNTNTNTNMNALKLQQQHSVVSSNSNSNSPTSTSNTVYGHVHIPKTGGSNLNGLMAAKYDNVCGNKGYSYDSYQFNVRAKRDNITEDGKNIDSVSLAHKQGSYDRGKPGGGIVKEVGFEDCDYISYETRWDVWPRIKNDLEFAKYNMTLELHVPCREPIEHLLSMGNNQRKKFNCALATANEEGFQRAINNVFLELTVPNRFNSESFLLYKNQIQIQNQKHQHQQNHPKTTNSSNNSNESIKLKCFKPIPLDPYLEYMGQQGRMRHRRFESPYVMRTTNKKRNNGTECMWEQSPEFLERVRQYLVETYPYSKFCDECMGSNYELKLMETKAEDAVADGYDYDDDRRY